MPRFYKTMRFWFVLQLNLCWALAIGVVLGYAFTKEGMDHLVTPFICFQIVLGWAAGVITGMLGCQDQATSTSFTQKAQMNQSSRPSQ